MISIQSLKKHKLKIITLILYLATLIYKSDIFLTSIKTTGGYLKEMFQILPAVFIISGLITVWVPKEIIIKNFGKSSGLKGKFMSIFMGSISAGPIYAAFPVAFSLLSKGASISNVVIIISSWAAIKIPMLIVESKFLSYSFMITRTLLTIPAILIIGYSVKRLVKREDVLKSDSDIDNNSRIMLKIENVLPQYNCGSCGFNNCRKYAEAIVSNNFNINKCSVGGKELENKIENILGNKKGGVNCEDN